VGLKYLLDANVLSEVAKKEPNLNVLARLEASTGQFCTCVTVWHEMQFGVELLIDSKRKASLSAYLDSLERGGLPILPYEKAAGEWLARERSRLSKMGIVCSYADGVIAAVAATKQLILVTRNVGDFENYHGLLIENWFILTS
jgi:tRNA(fMet)-specific endonuclease VapC